MLHSYKKRTSVSGVCDFIYSFNTLFCFQEYQQSIKYFGLGLVWVQTVCKGYQQMALSEKKIIFACCVILLAFLASAVFFKNINFFGIPSEC